MLNGHSAIALSEPKRQGVTASQARHRWVPSGPFGGGMISIVLAIVLMVADLAPSYAGAVTGALSPSPVQPAATEDTGLDNKEASKTARIALVIGNSAYSKAPLINPRNDVALMARTLEQVGFEVLELIDGDQAQMRQIILSFGRKLRERGKDSVGLFYYAGHGVQVNGENYLIPLSADIKDTSEVPLAGVRLNMLLRTMAGAQSRLNIAILDACRDNPFPVAVRGGTRGLASVRAPSGTYIAYATGPGDVAFDGKTGNSPYTLALSKAIHSEGATIEEVFRKTRRQVLDKTEGRQTPWEHSSLTGKFFFLPERAQAEDSRISDAERLAIGKERLREISAWDRIKDTGDIAGFRQHIEAFPGGIFAELAALKLSHLEAQPGTPWSWIITGALPQMPAGSQADQFYEQAVQREGDAQSTTRDVALSQAVDLYRQAADLGQIAAMYRLGRAYDRGLGVKRDLKKALTWYQKASDNNHPAAMAALGTMFEFGEGTKPNLALALRLYRLAAERGDPRGMAALGYLYAKGKGVAQDARQARRWYGIAAERGLPRAMFNLALMLAHGEGGKRDIAEAVDLFDRAAGAGHAGAMRELAYRYDEGRGVPRNSKRAATYLFDAIAAGNAQALKDSTVKQLGWNFATRRHLQRKLTERGLYDGFPHGFLDKKTRTALTKLAATSSN